MAGQISRLRHRAEFLKVSAEGRKWVTHGLIIQVKVHTPQALGSSLSENSVSSVAHLAETDVVLPMAVAGAPAGAGFAVRIGFTASRKVGGAVQRNRARRRLKAIVQEFFKVKQPAASFDLVVIARPATLERDYITLQNDLIYALKKIEAPVV